MRVVSDYPAAGRATFGLQPVFTNLSREQKKIGYDVKVIAALHKGEPRVEFDNDVEIRRVPIPFNLNAYRELRKLISVTERPVVHTHATAGIFLVATKGLLQVPHVAHVHGTSHSHYIPTTIRSGKYVEGYSALGMEYYFLRERLLWGSANRILSISNQMKADLVDFYDIQSDKIIPVFNGVDTDLFREVERPALPDSLRYLLQKDVILYVGHFGIRKGLPYLIAAMKAVVARNPNAILLCIGGVPEWLGKEDYWGFLQDRIKALNLQENVLLLDRMPNSQLPSFYSLAKVFVLPSYYEGFGKVIVEAMACSRPVIATKKGGPLEVLSDQETGLLVDYGSSKQISDGILRLLENRRLAVEMGFKGRQKVLRDFTWSAVANRITSVYDSLGESQ
ncbi:MAG: glycosyltransferase family 4 protein [Nitrososphaerota archaeon]|nr:glycosyltransferase family 4 protein [Nitrososphaerota archaeon]